MTDDLESDFDDDDDELESDLDDEDERQGEAVRHLGLQALQLSEDDVEEATAFLIFAAIWVNQVRGEGGEPLHSEDAPTAKEASARVMAVLKEIDESRPDDGGFDGQG